MAGGIGLQIKTGAAGLLDNGVAGWGIATDTTTDVGGIHMQVDGYVSVFDKPTNPTDHWSMSVFARMLNDSAGTGTQGYSASWDRFGDGTCTLTLASWAAGAFTILGTPATGIATPAVGDKISIVCSGSNITALINGVQKAAVTDATITTGQFGGIHFLRNTTASNVFMDKFAVFKVTAPVNPPPNPPPSGWPTSRQAMLWPGPVTNPFNVPFGDGATFNSVGFNSGGDPVKSFRLGISINGCGYAVPPQNQDPPTDNEMHTAYVHADQISEHETYGKTPLILPTINLRTDMLSYTGMGACKFAFIFGIIRKYDMEQGAIRHAMGIFLMPGDLGFANTGTRADLPALGIDGTPLYQGGPYHIGSRLGIPWGTAKPALSTQGSMVWDAAMTYGFFVTNQAGNTSLTVEALFDDSWAQALRNSGDVTARIWPACRLLTNGGGAANGYAGPVVTARRAPAAPSTFV